MLTITLYGAANEVTGSNTLFDLDGEQFVVDCGMFQGEVDAQEKNHARFAYDVRKVHAAVLTHAHLDHCGRLPLLTKAGFRGPIFATRPTIELTEIVLNDAVHVAEDRAKHGGPPPPYTLDDVRQCMDQFRGVDYGEPFVVTNHCRGTLVDAGHVLGSAHVLLETGTGRVVVSGDIGNPGAPIVEDPTIIDHADVVVMEATYGDREHEAVTDRTKALHDLLASSLKRGGTILIPAFALERTQEILYAFASWQKDGILSNVPVFVDSPMAIAMLDVFRRHKEDYDAEATNRATSDQDPFLFHGLTLTRTPEASKAIAHAPNPKIVIAGSGMMDGGRVLHHLKAYLPDPTATVIAVGHQSTGTLGRDLIDGRRPITIHGEPVDVKAHIEAITYLSAHADQAALLNWLKPIKGVRAVLVEHSDETARTAFAELVHEKLGLTTLTPGAGEPIRIQSINHKAATGPTIPEITEPNQN